MNKEKKTMDINLTLDASTLIEMFFEQRFAKESDQLITLIFEETKLKLYLPTIAILEFYSASLNLGKNYKESSIFLNKILNKAELVDLSSKTINSSLNVIKKSKAIRGMDSIYIATAIKTNSMLISLDNKQLDVAKNFVKSFTLIEFLKYLNKIL